MQIRFMAEKNDKSACRALAVLERLGQKTTIFEKEPQISELRSEASEILVAVFTSTEPKLIRRGHASRTASHRIMEYSPEWASFCQLLVAVVEDLKDINLVGMTKE